MSVYCPGCEREHRKQFKHGFSAYRNHACRCDICRTANAALQARVRARLRAGDVPAHVHGTDNGYTNYYCRCERCRQAHNRPGGIPS